jgi:hypothetical protein
MSAANESSYLKGTSKPIPACTVIPNCPLSADIVLVSSNGDRFGTHCKNLGEFTGGFPLDIAPDGEDVSMPDLSSEVLSLFLKYIHHHRQPDLSRLSFECLSQLAEAVEKYDVYSATEICKMHMSSHAENHCVEVFQYASEHGYRDLMDAATRTAIEVKSWNNEISEVCNRRSDLQSAWYRYNEYWRSLFEVCYNEPQPILVSGGIPSCQCIGWRKFRNVVISQVKREIAIFSKFGNIVDDARYHVKDCGHCDKRADRWKKRVLRQHISIGDSTTPFSTFLT